MSTTVTRAVSRADVPVIDIGPLRDDTDAKRVARELDWAATEVGFIYVANHGVSAELMESARRVALEFFRAPEDSKLQVSSNMHHHGYLKPGATKMYDDARVDLKESYNWGVELNTSAPVDNPLLGPNPWPEFLPELKAAVYPYFEASSKCAIQLLRAFAIALDLPQDTFIKLVDRPVSRGSLQYYPPQPADADEEQFGVAPHTDFGVLTVLRQDEVGGLEIQGLDGEWLAVPPIPGTFVVNVGDLLERWTNGHYRSTPHRVINSSGRERLSLVTAFDPNYETLIDPHVFCAPGEQPGHEPISCGDYLMWRFKKAFEYRQ